MMMYVEWAVVSALLFLVWRKLGDTAYVALAGVFLLILADDLVEIHEWTGLALAGNARRTRLEALGELVGFGVLAIMIIALLAMGWIHSGQRARLHMIVFVALIGFIAVFAVGIDFIHSLVLDIPERLLAPSFGRLRDHPGRRRGVGFRFADGGLCHAHFLEIPKRRALRFRLAAQISRRRPRCETSPRRPCPSVHVDG